MTPIEAATNVVRQELGKMAHDPKEIARLAVKAYLEAATKELASTGMHATEDFFFPNEPRIPRVPAVFCNGDPAAANNTPTPTKSDVAFHVPGELTKYFTFPAASPVEEKKQTLTEREVKHNFSTNALLNLIKDENAASNVPTITIVDVEAGVDEPAPEVQPTVAPVRLPDVSEQEVILWFYKALVEHEVMVSGDVLDLSLTSDGAGLDSLDVVELVMHAEEEFDISISDDEYERLSTLYDFITLIVTKRTK